MPDFIIIGAMKAGTTTLHAYLCKHKQIFMAAPKEPQFFSRDHVYARGIQWYQALFSAASPEQICGEASTCYSRWPRYPNAPTRITRHVPKAKLIYIMRHPVERTYSHYGHRMQVRLRRGEGPIVTFEDFLKEDDEAISASVYMRQIERYLEVFPRSQLLLLTLDDFRADPASVLSQVQQFLNVERAELVSAKAIIANRSGVRLAKSKISNVLRSVRSASGVSLVADMVPRPWRSRARNTVINVANSLVGPRVGRRFQSELSPLRHETRSRLLETFRAPTEALEVFLGRDLSSWFQ